MINQMAMCHTALANETTTLAAGRHLQPSDWLGQMPASAIDCCAQLVGGHGE